MKKKEILKYIILLIFFYLSLVFIFTLSRGDTFVNFGFSYAISQGEIPYNDFNMVIPPFAPLIYSIGLLFCKNILIYYLEQAILLTILFYYINKLLNNKSVLFLLCLIIPYPIVMVSIIFPGYNFLLLFLFFLFIYYFKNSNNNLLLGIILGLIFCTKQTVGLTLFLPTFYYLFKDQQRFLKITIGYLSTCFLLVCYLILTNSLNNFVNLCFLGLFDFGQNNRNISIFYFILFLIGEIYLIYRVIKDKNNLLLYYAIIFGIVILPIIDYYHVCLFLIVPIYFYLENIKYNIKYSKYIITIIISICCIWSFITYKFLNGINIANYNNFSLVINKKDYNDNSKKLLKYTTKLDKKVIYFMRGSENYFYKIVNNEKIDYFDLPNYGNYGYNGLKILKNKISKVNNTYFVLDRELVNNTDSNQQYIKELGQFVIKKSNYKINSIGVYDIYYKE